MSFLAELKRRNVLRVGAAYIVTAWLVVQVAETLFPIYGLSDSAVRMVVNVLAVGLVPVLVLAWVFEWTPEGLKRDADVDSDAPSSVTAAKRLDRIILAVLALALGYFAFDKFVLDPQRQAKQAEQQQAEVQRARQEGRSEAIVESYGDASIAVLAFADMSPGKDQEYLSDGIAEEILHLLEKVDGLRVISRTSAFSYKGKDTPIPEIARQLNVAHILEGSVRKAGDRIRVTAQLIEAGSDTHIWSETYDRTLDDIFAIQDELAAAMVNQLQVQLLGDVPTQKRIDPEAYMLWLEGRHLAAYIDAPKAVLLLEQAVSIAPEFADAWKDLARAYYLQSPTSRMVDHEGDVYWSKAKAAEQKLARIDPEHPWLLGVRGWDAAMLGSDFAEALRLFENALSLHPQDWDINRGAAMMARYIRRDELALALIRPFLDKDPLCADCSYQYSRTALESGRYEEAIEEMRRFRSLAPNSGGTITLATALILADRHDEAREIVARLRRDPGSFGNELESRTRIRYLELLIRLHEGESPLPIGEIEELLTMVSPEVSLTKFEIAQLYVLAENHDRAFELINETVADFAPVEVASLTRAPLLRDLHDDPRWIAMLEPFGLAPQQLAEIEFNPPLPELKGSGLRRGQSKGTE